jgi:hypothetical protein
MIPRKAVVALSVLVLGWAEVKLFLNSAVDDKRSHVLVGRLGRELATEFELGNQQFVIRRSDCRVFRSWPCGELNVERVTDPAMQKRLIQSALASPLPVRYSALEIRFYDRFGPEAHCLSAVCSIRTPEWLRT